MWQRRARARRHDRWKRKTFAAFVAQRLLEEARDFQLAHSGADLRQRMLERARGDAVRGFDERQLAGVLSLAQRLHEIERGTPLPTCAGLEKSLKVAMHEVRRLEADHLDVRELPQLLP